MLITKYPDDVRSVFLFLIHAIFASIHAGYVDLPVGYRGLDVEVQKARQFGSGTATILE